MVATYSSYEDAERAVDSRSEASPLGVLIAGGGVAGLETLMALRGLAPTWRWASASGRS
jgi:NADH dehydrogenase FAD-containing subunit